MRSSDTPEKKISKADAFSGATITGVLTFVLLTFTKELEPSHSLSPYLTDQTISLFAAIVSFSLVNIFSFLRYFVSIRLKEIFYTRKVNFIDKMSNLATTDEMKEELKKEKDNLIKTAINEIKNEKG